MGDNLQPTLDALAKALAALQASSEATTKALEANTQAIAALAGDRSSSSSSKEPSGEHHQDRPPKHWRPEFPRYDGKSDPLTFINKCESFFIQQRVMPVERTWMASYNLHDGASLVRPRPRDRGHADLGTLQGTPELALRATASSRTPLRALVVPPHRDRGGLLGPLPGPAPARWTA
jgi:hypothetical protein